MQGVPLHGDTKWNIVVSGELKDRCLLLVSFGIAREVLFGLHELIRAHIIPCQAVLAPAYCAPCKLCVLHQIELPPAHCAPYSGGEKAGNQHAWLFALKP
eukprot:1158108-Pelagomonas_calceolata.AAC.2